jgi:hypothetical protein
MGWIGCDLDHTLAEYESGMAETAQIGRPIPLMVERIKQHLANNYEVRIVTARVSPRHASMKWDVSRQKKAIKAWCKEHIGQELAVTCSKDYAMIFLYDDRCVAVEPGTGRLLSPEFPVRKRNQPQK